MTTASRSLHKTRLLVALAIMLTGFIVLPAGAGAQSGATAQVTPSAAEPLEPITVDIGGFLPGESVEVYYGGSLVGVAVADASGAASISGAVPDHMPADFHPMDVWGDMGSAVTIDYETLPATNTPTPPAPTPTAPTPPAPGTGGPSVIVVPPAVTPTPQAPATPTPAGDESGGTPETDQADTADEGNSSDESKEGNLAPGELATADTDQTGSELPMTLIGLALFGVLLASGGLIILLARRSTTR
jgi:hypothetical protein